jgi:dihydrofolate reductase
MAYADGLLAAADALLLGRATYESFAEAWPSRSGGYSDRINAMPKYVASRTLRETTWNATVLEGDVPEAVAALKADDGGDLLKFGTGELSRTLLEHKLVDDYHLWLFPVLAGSGTRLFEGVEATLELLDTTRFASGIVVLRYGPK